MYSMCIQQNRHLLLIVLNRLMEGLTKILNSVAVGRRYGDVFHCCVEFVK
jgi:hypothetical protein